MPYKAQLVNIYDNLRSYITGYIKVCKSKIIQNVFLWHFYLKGDPEKMNIYIFIYISTTKGGSKVLFELSKRRMISIVIFD